MVDNRSLVSIDKFDAQWYDNTLSKKPTGRTENEESKYQKHYPINHAPLFVCRPSIIVDYFGRILVWYLLGVLFQSRQVITVFLVPLGLFADLYLTMIE
jgi:hypothetical protein